MRKLDQRVSSLFTQAHSNVNCDPSSPPDPRLPRSKRSLFTVLEADSALITFFWRILEKLSLASVAATHQQKRKAFCFVFSTFSVAEEQSGSEDKEGGRDNKLPQRPLPAEQ